MKNFKQGFTLIELLIVVAIIGILASVVIISLNGARAKGDEAAVKSNLNMIRGEAELFAANNNGSFGTFSIAPCPAYTGAGTSMFTKDKSVANAIVEAVKRGGNGSSCYASPVKWAVAVGLKSSANASWCVDSAGASEQETFLPASAIDPVLFTCK